MPGPGTSWEKESSGLMSGIPISGIPRYRETRHPFMIPISVLISCNIGCDVRNSDIGNTPISGHPYMIPKSGFIRNQVYPRGLPDIGVYFDIRVYPISGILRYRVLSKTFPMSGTISGYMDVGYCDSDIGLEFVKNPDDGSEEGQYDFY
jgi:hypothetical protein